MNWILVIYIYAGALATGDSVTITHIPNFKSKQECAQSGREAKELVGYSSKEYRFVCLAQEK